MRNVAASALPSLHSWFASRNPWELTSEAVLIGTLLFSPLALGTVEAWSELVVIIAGATLSVLIALRMLLDRTFHVFWTWAYLPLALFILLAVLQAVPLPASWVERLSAPAFATRAELVGDSPGWTTLSFYPLASFHGLRLVLVGTAIFTATLLTFQRPEQIRVLLAALFAAGVIVALIALLQILTFSSQIYWSIEAGGGIATAGPFVNHSHFSQFMNLAIGAGVALLLVRLREEEDEANRWQRRTTDSRRAHGSDGIRWAQQSDRSLPARADLESGLNVSNRWLLAGLVVCAVSVFTSLSRNGALSLAIGATVIGTALYWRRILTWRGWVLAVLPWAALGVLLIVGFDAVYERLASLQEDRNWSFRWEMTAATLRAWREYPIWGTGLGTHEYVFPMFDRAAVTSIAAHADNDYAQLLEEMGILGAGLVAAFLGVIGLHALRLIHSGTSPLSAAAFGLVLGLLAVAIHSASDFGQHIPAVFSLSAVTCGLLINIDRIETGRRKQETVSIPTTAGVARSRLLWGGVSVVAVALVWSWAMQDAYAAYVGESHWKDALAMEARLSGQSWQGTDDEFVDLLSSASAAADAVPANVKYAYWLNLYRWYSVSRTVDEETGQVLLHPASIPIVERIADELSRARRICPTYGPPYAVEGQLRMFVLGDPSGGELISKGYELASYDPQTCLVAGRLAAAEGAVQEAVDRLTRAVELQPASYREVAGVFLFELGRPDLATALAGDDYGRLTALARMAASSEQYAGLEAELTTRAHAELRERASAPDATVNDLIAMARIEAELGNLEAAASLYRRGSQADYDNVSVRLALAEVLVQLGRIKEAMYEARICLRMRPDYEPAKQLIEKLSVL